jgi:hypothetical protein
MWNSKTARQTRKYTTALLDAVQEGILDKDSLINDLLGYMSESEVEAFVSAYDLEEAIGMEEVNTDD